MICSQLLHKLSAFRQEQLGKITIVYDTPHWCDYMVPNILASFNAIENFPLHTLFAALDVSFQQNCRCAHETVHWTSTSPKRR